MKRKDERLDQRLGDFAPLHRPINEIQLERLLDRYGIALVCDYPQILFEHRDQLLLPGWQYRESRHEYLTAHYDRSPRQDHREVAGPKNLPTEATVFPRQDYLTRLCSAYRVLDEIFAPASKAPSYRPNSGRNGYGTRARSDYS